MALRGLMSTVAIFGTFTDAIPTIAFPLNSQVPPVARISEQFSYTFSTSTFLSTLPIIYTLSSGPAWLSLDSQTRTLSGTPSKKDAGTDTVTGVPIGITASDSSGSIALNSTLVISKNPAPLVKVSASLQLPFFGFFSSPSALLYNPSTSLKFNFDPGTFSGSGLNYYAITIDNTPLPSWVIFDNNTLSFSGLTPDYASLIQPPQVFGIQLIASDVEGFAGTSISFEIEVGVHLLAIVSADLVINATEGTKVSYKGLADAIQIDGRVAKTSEIQSITAKTPPWLTSDNTTLAFSGTVPEDATPYNITVDVIDIYEDTAKTTVLIDVPTAIFSKDIRNLNATIGAAFEYNLNLYFHDTSDIEISAEFSDEEPWLFFNPKTLSLSGDIPANAKPTEIGVTLKAAFRSSKTSSSRSFKLAVTDGAGKPSSFATVTTSRSSSASAPSATGNLGTTQVESPSGLSAGAIIAIAVPLSLLFVAILLALSCYVYRRRATRSRPGSPLKSEMSTPHEAPCNVVEIPFSERALSSLEPLRLDMSSFGRATSSVLLSAEAAAGTMGESEQMMRRSQTPSTISNPRLSKMLRESDASGNRVRSPSDNAMCTGEKGWISTQESSHPVMRPLRTNSSQKMSRNYSNYSRKGHARRSARVLSLNGISTLKESAECRPTTQQTQQTQSIQPAQPRDSILNLKDGNFSFIPIGNFSALSTQTSIKYTTHTARYIERPNRTRSMGRHSRLIPHFGATAPGIGHGGRESISPISRESGKRKSVGHGQDWVAANGLLRDSKTWPTVATAEGSKSKRQSNASNYSVYAEAPAPRAAKARMSIRIVPKSSSINSPLPGQTSSLYLSDSSVSSRSLSRRAGSSPFFGGSSIRNSRKSSRRMRTSYVDSPTVPEETTLPGLEETILQGMLEVSDEPLRDSFGISYGHAREGTRQLRSYIQNQLNRTRTRDSMRSIESKNSRFESATNSMLSLPQSRILHNTPQGQGNKYEECLEEDHYSEGSWETNHTILDSQGNIIEYAPEDSPEVAMAATAQARASLIAVTGSSMSNPNSPMPDIGPNARVAPGMLRRPVSVNGKATGKRSSRVGVEGGSRDYTAYI